MIYQSAYQQLLNKIENMSIYISKNAIDSIPLVPQDTNVKVGELRSILLRRSKYLNELAVGNLSYAPLEKGKSSNEAVRLIKLALNTIDELNILYPGFNIGYILDTNSYEFNQGLEDAVKLFQSFSGYPQTGIIDSQTLLEIDDKLKGDMLFDNEHKKYIGKNNKKVFSFRESISSQGKYVYSVFLTEIGEEIKLEIDNPLKATIIKQLPNNKMYAKPQGLSKQELLDNPKIKEIAEKNKLTYIYDGNNPNDNFNLILKSPIEISIDADYSSIIDFEIEAANTPPQLFDDVNEKLIKVKANDTISGIIEQNYYGTGNYAIKNPYNGSDLFILPQRTPFPINLRHEDARYQFYLNLLYYFNSEEINGNLNEWGITKSNGHLRYGIDHLNATNVFDNSFDSDNPQTGLPNYYRFLKNMESLDSNYKLNFDPQTGESTSFNLVPGKNLRIPSRKFADSLYNFLNYRPNEMMHEVSSPNPQEDEGIMDWLLPDALDEVIETIGDTIDSISNLATEVKQDAIELYHETAEFFKRIYDFAIDFLVKYWPRGAGGQIKAGGSITWGIPVKTEAELSKKIWRKMSLENELTIVYNREFVLGVGADVVTGASIGFNSGHGSSKKSFGLEYGAGLGNTYKAIISNEYEFPIRKEETALLTMIINVFGGEMVNETANILEHFEVINLNPRQYLTKFEAKFEGSASGWASAQIGLNGSKGLNIPDSNTESDSDQNNNKSFGFIDNISQKVSGIGYTANARFTAGLSFTYSVDYGNNPLVFMGNGGRVFKKIDLDTKCYLKAQVDTQFLGNFLQRIFAETLPGVNSVVEFLQFDKGVMLGLNYSLERIGAKEEIQAGDLKFINTSPIVDFIADGGIRYDSPNTRIVKKVDVYFGTYSGDTDTLCEPGSEVKFNINAGVLYQMCSQGTNYDYSFDSIYSLFRSFTYRKKVGIFNFENYNKKKLVVKRLPDRKFKDKIVGAFTIGNPANYEVEMTTRMLSYCLKNANMKDNLFLSTGLAIDLQMTIDFNSLKNVFEFYIKKLYYTYVILNGNPLISNSFYDKNKIKINNFIKTEYGASMITLKGKDYYDMLFTDGFIKKQDGSFSTVSGLLKVMNDRLNSLGNLQNNI